MPDWDDVVEIAQRFPGVETAQSYGTPALKVKGKFMCRLRTNPDALVIRGRARRGRLANPGAEALG